jgi:hypothetical protein
MQKEPPHKETEETPEIFIFLTQKQAEVVNAALARFLFLIENSETDASELFRNSLPVVLAQLRDTRSRASLIHPTDREALMQLALLNQSQRQADQSPEGSLARIEAEEQFNTAFIWFQLHNQAVHRDRKTGLWRSGTWIGRRAEQ